MIYIDIDIHSKELHKHLLIFCLICLSQFLLLLTWEFNDLVDTFIQKTTKQTHQNHLGISFSPQFPQLWSRYILSSQKNVWKCSVCLLAVFLCSCYYTAPPVSSLCLLCLSFPQVIVLVGATKPTLLCICCCQTGLHWSQRLCCVPCVPRSQSKHNPVSYRDTSSQANWANGSPLQQTVHWCYAAPYSGIPFKIW